MQLFQNEKVYLYLHIIFVHSSALWILIFMVFFCSHRVFRTIQNSLNLQFRAQCLLLFVSQVQMLGNLETLHRLVVKATR